MNALRMKRRATGRAALLAGRTGLMVAVMLASTAAGAVVEIGAAALQRGYWLGLNQVFYNSGWDERVGTGVVAAGHALADFGAFATSSQLSSSAGLYEAAGLAETRITDYSSNSLANFELQGSVRDVIHVVSDTLPVGTPISIEARVYLAAPAVPGVRATLTLGGIPYFTRLDGGSGAPPAQMVVRQFDDWLRVGDSILVDSGYRLSVGVERGNFRLDPFSLGSFSIRGNCLGCGFGDSLATNEVGSMAPLGFAAQSASVSLIADSGHDYSILVVPEPSTYALLLIGLVVVGMTAGRRGHLSEGAGT